MNKRLLIILLFLLPSLGWAQTEVYPDMLLVTNVELDDFEQDLIDSNQFNSISQKAYGAPIALRIIRGVRERENGLSVSSLFVSASSLGIIPVVTNKESRIQYELYVQGELIAKFNYEKTTTEVESGWVDKPRVIPEWEKQFIKQSIALFLRDLDQHEQAQAIFQEYWQYFPR